MVVDCSLSFGKFMFISKLPPFCLDNNMFMLQIICKNDWITYVHPGKILKTNKCAVSNKSEHTGKNMCMHVYKILQSK